MMSFKTMNTVLDCAHARPADPILLVRKATHAQVWCVWASLEGTAAEEIFEGSSEREALEWIASGGQTWLEERRRRRNS
jgi:hemolysin-activating ACP:hemolysin acyltransferase